MSEVPSEVPMFNIEDGIDQPDARNLGKPQKYPWDKMEVGNSFVGDAKARSAMTSFNNYVEDGRKFSSLKIKAGEYRIWRIS